MIKSENQRPSLRDFLLKRNVGEVIERSMHKQYSAISLDAAFEGWQDISAAAAKVATMGGEVEEQNKRFGVVEDLAVSLSDEVTPDQISRLVCEYYTSRGYSSYNSSKIDFRKGTQVARINFTPFFDKTVYIGCFEMDKANPFAEAKP